MLFFYSHVFPLEKYRKGQKWHVSADCFFVLRVYPIGFANFREIWGINAKNM